MAWFRKKRPGTESELEREEAASSTSAPHVLSALPPLTRTPQLPGFSHLMRLGVSDILNICAQGVIGHETGYILRLDGSVAKWVSRVAYVDPQRTELEPVRFMSPQNLDLSDVRILAGGSSQLSSRCPYFVVKSDGSAWQWTATYDGSREVPERICELSEVTDLVTDSQNSNRLALTSHGTVYAWGHASFGHLGNGTRSGSDTVPTLVPGLEKIVSVAVEDVCHALDDQGVVWTWGESLFDVDLDGDADDSKLAPSRVGALPPVTTIGTGRLAIDSEGSVWAWDSELIARKVDGLSDVVAVDSFTYGWGGEPGGQTCHAIRSDGSLWGWGANAEGQIGDGTMLSRATPVRIEIPVAVDATLSHQGRRWILGKDGSLWEWGGADASQPHAARPREVALPSPQNAAFFEKWATI